MAHVGEVLAYAGVVVNALRDFLFWKSPVLSILANVLWQLVITYPQVQGLLPAAPCGKSCHTSAARPPRLSLTAHAHAASHRGERRAMTCGVMGAG